MTKTKTIKPNKQRKRIFNAKLHECQNLISAHLSSDLRKKYNKRSFTLRKGDTVKVKVGRYGGTKGKISKVDLGNKYVTVEGILIKRKDGAEVPVKFNSSNLEIQELYSDDERRFKNIKKA